MTQFDGYLFAKLHLIGTKSEGPMYFLQQFDYRELLVVKQVDLWKDDPQLHPHLGTKVTITGEQSPKGIEYDKISPYQPPKESEETPSLNVQLAVSPSPLWINVMPGGSHPPAVLNLTLQVRWPHRSIWEGSCPTTQIYDFWIEHNNKEIWRWSDGRVFMPYTTTVTIPGSNSFQGLRELWAASADDVPGEGVYVAKAVFIASDQEVEQSFEIKFAQ